MRGVGRWTRGLALGIALATTAHAQTPCQTATDCAPEQECHRPIGNCAGEGWCADRLGFCPQIFSPACGCDGRSYVSACAARQAGGGAAHSGACCVGACTSLDRVDVGDLRIGIGQGLGAFAVASCHSFDRDQSARVTIDELIAAVGNALHGCR